MLQQAVNKKTEQLEHNLSAISQEKHGLSRKQPVYLNNLYYLFRLIIIDLSSFGLRVIFRNKIKISFRNISKYTCRCEKAQSTNN